MTSLHIAVKYSRLHVLLLKVHDHLLAFFTQMPAVEQPVTAFVRLRGSNRTLIVACAAILGVLVLGCTVFTAVYVTHQQHKQQLEVWAATPALRDTLSRTAPD